MSLKDITPSFQFPWDGLGLSNAKKAWVNGTEPTTRVNENFAGLARSAKDPRVFPVTTNEEATFVLNAALDGATTMLDAKGDKNAFQQAAVRRGLDIQSLQSHLSRSLGANDTANITTAQLVNFYRGAEIMRDTMASMPPGTNRNEIIAAAKKNILYRVNQAGQPGVVNFRTMDNKPITDPKSIIPTNSTILPVGVDQAKRIQQQVLGKPFTGTAKNNNQIGTTNGATNTQQNERIDKENKNSSADLTPKSTTQKKPGGLKLN